MRDRSILSATVAMALTLGVAGVAAAQQPRPAYPCVVGSGENASVEYGPGPQGNVVGGGPLVVTGQGEQAEARYTDPRFAQAPGPAQACVGSGESSDIPWNPAPVARREAPAR